jgi:hypothetical protein
MFTVDRSSLRNSTKRRDYVFSTDHQKSYLTPSSNGNPSASSDSNADAATTVDADANPDANMLVDNLNFDIDDDLCDTSDIDSVTETKEETTQGSLDSLVLTKESKTEEKRKQ